MPVTSFSIGMDSPARMADQAAQAAGFAALKVKLGSSNEREMLEAVRRACPCPLRVDANEGWSTADLEAKLDWLADSGVELVEQPLPAGQDAALRPLFPDARVPLVADESSLVGADLPSLVNAYHGVNVKLCKCGGITRALEMIAVARALGLQVMLGCMIESSLGIAAALPLAPLVDWVDLDGNLLVADDPFEGLTLEEGRWLLPSGPGLGVTPRN
jgi:L-alanine-DL-glutamate epimerase-like enolase superfamily enzyme